MELMEIRPSEISSILKEQIKNFGQEAEVSEIGQVLSVGDGIARIPCGRLIWTRITRRFPRVSGGSQDAPPDVRRRAGVRNHSGQGLVNADRQVKAGRAAGGRPG